jgi:hypothetical protein
MNYLNPDTYAHFKNSIYNVIVITNKDGQHDVISLQANSVNVPNTMRYIKKVIFRDTCLLPYKSDYIDYYIKDFQLEGMLVMCRSLSELRNEIKTAELIGMQWIDKEFNLLI